MPACSNPFYLNLIISFREIIFNVNDHSVHKFYRLRHLGEESLLASLLVEISNLNELSPNLVILVILLLKSTQILKLSVHV